MTSNIKNERQPKILKVKYFSNHRSDLSQILNVNFCEQINCKNVSNEDDLQCKTTSNIKIERQPQILKVIYLSNHWPDLPQILNLSLCDQTKL